MKTMKSICLPLLMVTGAIVSARSESIRTDINPALRYNQAFMVAPDLSQADRDCLMTNEWRGQKLPDRFGELVGRYNNQFILVRPAAHATVPCDWGVDWSQGPYTLLPHLARIKGIAQAARLRAMWDLQQGRQAEARDDMLAAFAMARHGSSDGCLISVLVQIATENILCSTVAENVYQFSPETLKQLADGFDAAPARGTMAAAMALEKSSARDWILNKILELQKENPGNDTKAREAVRKLFEDQGSGDGGQKEPDPWPRIVTASGGTSDGMLKLLRDMEPFYQRADVIMALPRIQYEDQMQQFSADVQNSANPFVSALFPALEKARPREFASLVELAMVRAAVEYKLHGEEGLKSVIDPCGTGPFTFQRFVFEGVDRGFELKSAYAGRGFQEALIFVEKNGPPFNVNGKNAGKAPSK